MLSLIELERVAAFLANHLVGARVQRWLEPERGCLAFSLHQPTAEDPAHKKIILQIDARPDRAHLGRLSRLPSAPPNMPAFTAYLRAHLSRARVESVSIRGGDRQLEIELSAREGVYRLLLSVFGRRSNLYLLDESGTLLQALRPLAETRAELALGAVYLDPGGLPPSTGKDRFANEEGWTLLDAIAEVYAERSEKTDQADTTREILQALRKEKKSTARRIERLEAELAEAEMADRLARNGELLKSNLGRVEAGARSVRVDGWGGEPVEIELDPKLSARGNLEAIFKRYQKLLRRLTKAGGQIDLPTRLRQSKQSSSAIRSSCVG